MSKLIAAPNIVTPAPAFVRHVERVRRGESRARTHRRFGGAPLQSPGIINSMRFGGGGGGGASTPDVILGTDLLAWYKRGTGIYDALSGGSLVTTNGQEIGRWEDQSGNAYHWVRNGALTFGHTQWSTTTTYLGVGTVAFSGSVVDFIIPDAMVGALGTAGQGEMWVSFKLIGASSGAGAWTLENNGNNNQFEWTDGHVYEGFGSSARKDTGTPSVQSTIASAFHVYDVYTAPSDWQNYFDSVSQFSTASNTVAFRTTGARWWMYANVSEVVFSTAKATTTQRGQMYTYFTT